MNKKLMIIAGLLAITTGLSAADYSQKEGLLDQAWRYACTWLRQPKQKQTEITVGIQPINKTPLIKTLKKDARLYLSAQNLLKAMRSTTTQEDKRYIDMDFDRALYHSKMDLSNVQGMTIIVADSTGKIVTMVLNNLSCSDKEKEIATKALNLYKSAMSAKWFKEAFNDFREERARLREEQLNDLCQYAANNNQN